MNQEFLSLDAVGASDSLLGIEGEGLVFAMWTVRQCPWSLLEENSVLSHRVPQMWQAEKVRSSELGT